jgi:hypothetical protein
MNAAFIGHSDAGVSITNTGWERTAMTTLVNFLKRLARHHERFAVADQLLRDIGLSRVLIEFT